MITIPLSTVVSYLTRKRVDLACLEGAPIVVGSDMQVLGPFYLREITRCEGAPPDFALYLGRDAACPAAMGWAAAVVHGEVGAFRVDADWLELWSPGINEPAFLWWWSDRGQPCRSRYTQRLSGMPPATPAARLRAVLEYEMGRDQ